MLKIAHGAWYAHPLPDGHRFPMLKYELIPEQLIREGTCTAENFFEPGELDEKWILAVHDQAYWNDLKTLNLSPRMVRRIGFPLTAELVHRETTIAQGTITCCHHALADGVSLNVAGGTHHAFPDRGEGCLLYTSLSVIMALAMWVVNLLSFFIFGRIPVIAQLWQLLIGWPVMMVGLSILTTLYGHYVQKRPLA